jgi:hypothetical protein
LTLLRQALGTALLALSASIAPVLADTTLRPVSDFDSIADPAERAKALFGEAAKVFTHPRCLNCHPVGDRPSQTDAMRAHRPLVVRGDAGHGAPGLPCSTCHHEANFDPAGVPGAPHWGLAPLSAGWQGLSPGAICEQVKDLERNGNKDMAALLHHLADDPLVGWAWTPGGNRSKAPGTQLEFGALMKAWADAGAACPVP